VAWNLVAVGEVLLDVSLPEVEPGAVVHAPVRIRAGGTPVNAAFAAAALGARVAVIGRIGADAAGAAIRAALAEAGVEPLLTVDERLATGSFVEAGAGAGKAVVADRGASASLNADDEPGALAAGAVLVSGYALLHDDTAPAAAAALARADARWVAVTTGSAALVRSCGAAGVHERARGANVLLANVAEARGLTGREPDEAAGELSRRYEVACVTLGPRGAVAASGGRVVHAAPAAATPSQLTGAGDAFAGALLVSLAGGADLGAALDAACASAARR